MHCIQRLKPAHALTSQIINYFERVAERKWRWKPQAEWPLNKQNSEANNKPQISIFFTFIGVTLNRFDCATRAWLIIGNIQRASGAWLCLDGLLTASLAWKPRLWCSTADEVLWWSPATASCLSHPPSRPAQSPSCTARTNLILI